MHGDITLDIDDVYDTMVLFGDNEWMPPDQLVRTSNPRLEFDCRNGFDVRVTPRDN